VLSEHRAGLEAVAHALLERETLDGEEVARLVDEAVGHKAGGPRKVTKADGTEVEVDEEEGTESADELGSDTTQPAPVRSD
jgi:hypothetical protein